MKFDRTEKALIAILFLAAVPIFATIAAGRLRSEIAAAIRSAMLDTSTVRARIVAEESARFIENEMPSAQRFSDRWTLLRHALSLAPKDGLYCEFGVAAGNSINFIAGLIPDRMIIHGFDSFEGLPETWRDGFPKGYFRLQGLPPVRRNVVLYKGWFDKTAPEFKLQQSGHLAFMHMDADLYSSTKTVFDVLWDRLVPGTVIVFDEFYNYPGWKSGESKAFSELVTNKGLKFSYLGYAQEQVAVKIDHVPPPSEY